MNAIPLRTEIVTSLSDAALVSQAQCGDAGAFESLYRTHCGRVHALCLRMTGNTADAEELTQEAFVRAWRKLESFRGESAFSGAVDVTFTEEVFGSYEVETHSGKIESNFGPPPQKKSRFGPGWELKFDHGDGDAEISITSFSGRVTLKNP